MPSEFGEDWRIWNRDDSVELRTYQRATGELPEMESTKQLVKMMAGVYSKGMRILDVGCAAGHYYRSLAKFDEAIDYTGVDPTTKYIEFARDTYKGTPAKFVQGDIFELSRAVSGPFDLVYCCNVLLHLPDFRIPIQNLLKATRRHCFIRTLIGERTLLARFLYKDEFDAKGNPTCFLHQNTYSFSLLESYIKSQGKYSVSLIEDRFESTEINKEFENYREKQSAVTRIVDGKQIAGNLVFQWAWLKISPQ